MTVFPSARAVHIKLKDHNYFSTQQLFEALTNGDESSCFLHVFVNIYPQFG